ncbi:MAG: NAD(P)/FAD-dependent oxidoreductase [Candidatus Woesearchaeota archaeon]
MPRKKISVDKNQKLSAYTVYTAKDEIDRDFGKVVLYTAPYDVEGHKIARYFDNHHVEYSIRSAEYPDIRVECESLLEKAGLKGSYDLPILLIDNRIIVRPKISDIEKALMIEDTQARELYDVVIIGAGVTGVSAALTANMRRLRTLVIERTRMLSSLESRPMVQTLIDYPEGVEGQDIAYRLREAIEARDDIVLVEGVFAKRLKELGNLYEVSTDGAIYRTKSVILALGASSSRYGIIGEEEFLGRGVYTDPGSEAKYSIEKSAVIIGNDEYAYHSAIRVSKYANHVTVFRHPRMARPDSFLEKKLKEHSISLIEPARIIEMRGNIGLESIKYVNTETGRTYLVDCSAAYVIGHNIHDTRWLSPVMDLDGDGRIITKDQYNTVFKGVFAGGDCTRKYAASLRISQLDGAAMAERARSYIESWNMNRK